NGTGAWGAAPGAEILSIKACQPATPGELDARCWSASVAAAIDLAIEEGARIVNLSIAGPSDPLVERLIAAALAKDVIVIAASGNGGANSEPSYPGATPGVIAVTAIDADGRLFRHATRGDFVDVAAPGVEVIAPAPDGYPALSGTSFATAFVSSAAALLLELEPDATADRIREALLTTGTDLGEPGRDPLYGNGGIDVCAAAEKLRAGAAVCP
ncbi:MAG: S8 family serine peptidase, partial [Deltaproteobacteria bacterium]|nr:S8 family serine peptidase [Deltaproteobacteria bacterium]